MVDIRIHAIENVVFDEGRMILNTQLCKNARGGLFKGIRTGYIINDSKNMVLRFYKLFSIPLDSFETVCKVFPSMPIAHMFNL